MAAESPRRGRLAVIGRRPTGGAGSAGAARVDADRAVGGAAALPFAGAQSLVVSAAAVRSALAAWAAAEPRDRADLVGWPQALLVAMALAEAGRAALGASPDAAPWELDVTVAPALRDLVRQTGLPPRTVRRAVDSLVSAEILDSVRRVGDMQVVRFRPTAFEDAPVAGLVSWEGVRARLGVDVSPAALLTVRELACRMTAEDRARSQFVSATLRELEDATGYGKGAVRSALGALARAAVVESRVRPRMDSWHRLLPNAFMSPGAPTTFPVDALEGPVLPAPVSTARTVLPARGAAPGATSPAVSFGAPEVGASDPHPQRASGHAVEATPADRKHATPQERLDAAEVSGRPDAGPASWAVVEINGVRLPVPPGVQPVPERDASGDWYLRVGPTLRYGPLRFFA